MRPHTHAESRLIGSEPTRTKPPKRLHCPQTWQFALVLCLISVFFLCGVMLGCYVGLMHRCKHTDPSDNIKKRKNEDPILQIPFVEILNNHERVLIFLKNSSLQHTITCKRDTLENLLDDQSSKLLKVLSSFDLYDVKSFSYPVLATRTILKIDLVGRAHILDDSTDLQPGMEANNFTFECDLWIASDVLRSNQSTEGVCAIADLQQADFQRKVSELVEKNVTRFLLYQGDGRCTHKAWMRVKLHKYATHHNVFMHLLSCEAQRKLFPVLETFPKDPNSNEPTSSDLNMHLSLQATTRVGNFTNVLSTFYGSRDPDLIILLGSRTCDFRGTQRSLQMLQAVTRVLFQPARNSPWSPYRSMKFISWSSMGVRDLIETYGEAWEHKVLVYFDLDDPTPDQSSTRAASSNNILIEASSSVQPFLQRVVQQLNFNNPNSTTIEIVPGVNSNDPNNAAQALEAFMGIPYVKLLKIPSGKTSTPHHASSEGEMKPDVMVLKFFVTAMLSIVDGDLMQLTVLESVKELSEAIKQHKPLAWKGCNRKTENSFERECIEKELTSQMQTLRVSSERLLQAMENFKNFMQLSPTNFESIYQVRKTNDLLLRLENELRVLIRQLPTLISVFDTDDKDLGLFNAWPVTWDRYFHADVYASLTHAPPHDHSWIHCGSRFRLALERLSHVDLKIRGLTRLVDIRQ